MPIIVSKMFGPECVGHPEYADNFLWRGLFSICHGWGPIVNFVQECMNKYAKPVSLVILQSDGVDLVEDVRRSAYSPDVYGYNQSELGVPTCILLTLCSRDVSNPYFLRIPLDDRSFEVGVYNHVSEHITRPPWNEKIPKVFWRGCASGCLGPENLRGRVTLKLRNNENADVKLIVPWDNPFVDELLLNTSDTTLYEKDLRPFQYYVNHKYNLILDGAVIASSLEWAFATGSVPILVTHPGNDWWFKRYLEPMKHYVPVNYDLSDLDDKLNWLLAYDDKAQEIAANAMEFSKYYLSSGFQKYHLENEIATMMA